MSVLPRASVSFWSSATSSEMTPASLTFSNCGFLFESAVSTMPMFGVSLLLM